MLFSIIVPAYNAADTIQRCIDSVRGQSFSDYELIVVNDGSTDATLEKLKDAQKNGLGSKMIIIDSENKGVSSARNKALSEAKGDFCIFLDSDDELTQDALSVYHKALRGKPKADIVMGDFIKKYPQKEKKYRIYGNVSKEAEYSENEKKFRPFISRTMGMVWGKCYRRNLFLNDTFHPELGLCEDAELNCRIFPKAREIYYVPEFVYRYYYSDDSTIRRFDAGQITRYVSALEKIKEFRVGVTEDFTDEFVCNVFNVICVNIICNPNNPAAPKEKIEAIGNTARIPVFSETFSRANLKKIPLKHRMFIIWAKEKKYERIYKTATLYHKL